MPLILGGESFFLHRALLRTRCPLLEKHIARRFFTHLCSHLRLYPLVISAFLIMRVVVRRELRIAGSPSRPGLAEADDCAIHSPKATSICEVRKAELKALPVALDLFVRVSAPSFRAFITYLYTSLLPLTPAVLVEVILGVRLKGLTYITKPMSCSCRYLQGVLAWNAAGRCRGVSPL